MGAAGAALLLLPRWLVLGLAVPIRHMFSFPVEGFAPLTPVDILLLAWGLRQTHHLLRRRNFSLPRSSIWLGAFIAWALISTLRKGVDISPLLRVETYAAISILLSIHDRHRERTYALITTYAIIRAAMAMPFLVDVPKERFGDPHQFGMLMVAGVAPLLAGHFNKWAAFLLVPLLSLAAVASFRRGVWFALAIMLLMATFKRPSPRRLVVLVLVGIVAGLSLYGPLTSRLGLNPGSLEIRRASLAQAFEVVQENPLLGAGWTGHALDQAQENALGSFPRSTLASFNLFVTIAAATGIVGLVLFVGYFVEVLRLLARNNRAGFLFASAFLALSMSEVTVFAHSLVTISFFIFSGGVKVRLAAIPKDSHPESKEAPIHPKYEPSPLLSLPKLS